MIRFNVVFTGRVQGVGFRATAEHIARRFNITGWVRNEPDGSVRCVAEGERSEVDAFIAAVQEQMGRYIRDTQIDMAEAKNDIRGFTVRF